ncbi:MAG TPA: hypothetical protein VFS43_15730 [Polyangiaceae bacterium]|nr:hypothetical protein [Polyangiaceae bacterium]
MRFIARARWALVWSFVAGAGGCSKPADGGPAAGGGGQAAASAPAPPKGWPDPHEACAYLDGRGYKNRGYKAYNPMVPNELTCQSLNRKVGGGTAVVGEAGFYYSVVGGPERADHMRLRVDLVRGGADEQAGLAEFAATAEELSRLAFKAPLPDEARAALKAGTAGTWRIEGGHELTISLPKEQPKGPFGQTYHVIAELR